MNITTQAPRARMSKAERRQQLLDTATAVIEAEGADALTLASVAEKAGVSKPVAYDHFETRTGLLLALLAQTDSLYEGVARAQISASTQTLEAIADIVAEAYIACAIEAGPAAVALVAAIEANGDASEVALASRNKHVAQFKDAFAPAIDGDAEALRLTYIALVAAANALCSELTQARIARAAATMALATLLKSTLAPYRRA